MFGAAEAGGWYDRVAEEFAALAGGTSPGRCDGKGWD
jgi:hypothetical protein